jgi:hypothetical protein
LASIARSIAHDAADKPLILFAPDETTRAMIDMYARTQVGLIPGPIDSGAVERLRAAVNAAPQSLVVVQLPGRAPLHGRLNALAQRLNRGYAAAHDPSAQAAAAESALSWLPAAGLQLTMSYSLPNGRRYALLGSLEHAAVQ